MPTIQLNKQQFIDEVFDYTTEKEFHFKGKQPAIIDFYADWCGPCKMIAPILEELSSEYPGVTIYKVNTEIEQELSQIFQIRSIPTMFFLPINKPPMAQAGALPKSAIVEIIEKELGVMKS